MAFPIVTGRSHGLAAAPSHGQVALGTKKVARPGGARNEGPALLSSHPAPLGHDLAPPPATGNAQRLGTPSNWERRFNGNAITLDFRKRRGGAGWCGEGFP